MHSQNNWTDKVDVQWESGLQPLSKAEGCNCHLFEEKQIPPDFPACQDASVQKRSDHHSRG
eukprot:3680569-Amphidinium_carterae.1